MARNFQFKSRPGMKNIGINHYLNKLFQVKHATETKTSPMESMGRTVYLPIMDGCFCKPRDI